MRLERASTKAIRYSCLNWHYSKSILVNPFAFSVFNQADEWCGCVLFSYGANASIGSQYGLVNGAVIELVRMALNGKQESTSKVLALSVRLLPKYMPTVKLIVSYADTEQGHIGTIYQACNWLYVDRIKSTPKYLHNEKWIHNRQADDFYSAEQKKALPKKASGDKLKYLYPLTPALRKQVKTLAKPYPKKTQPAAVV